jgi:uncharacterized RDD family membrane protein YckC
MVIEDFHYEKNRDSKDSNRKNCSAGLIERFFSFAIDYFVISPFVIFFLYLSYDSGFQFWKANPQAPESQYFVLILAVSYVFYFSLVQSLFIYWKGVTPGQHYLKIKIYFNSGESMLFLRIFSRQVLFWCSFAFLGFPFLELMTDKKRRTFYDRVADVEIQSLQESVESELIEEPRYWQAFAGTLALFCGFLMAALVWQYYDQVSQRRFSFIEKMQSSQLCAELGELRSLERLQTAVALNWVNEISDSCLQREADFVLWSVPDDELKSLAYYAKSLLADDAEVEKKYLIQACAKADPAEIKHYGCQVAQAFLESDIERFLAQPPQDNILDHVLRYEMAVVFGERRKAAEQFKSFSQVRQSIRDLKVFKKYHLKEFLVQYVKFDNGRQPASLSGNVAADKEFADAVINWVDQL